MAETKPTATASVKSTSVQAKKSSNAISWLAPVICIIAGYCIWRFIFGNPEGFKNPATGFFWPKHKDPKGALNAIYMGGIIVPILIGMLLMVIVFSIERFLTVSKALGNGSVSDFIRRVQYHLANRNVDSGEEGGGGSAATQLAVGISEALYNTAFGIGTSALSLIMYNVFTTKIDAITYGIDESGFTLTQSFASLYK